MFLPIDLRGPSPPFDNHGPVAEPITLILLVATGDAASPQTRAMAQATRDALGGASVEILETRDRPSDEDALALERGAHAAAVVELSWSGTAHRRATLRVHLVQPGRWIERSFGFSVTDASSEQGRTLGFAVASIFPDTTARDAPAPTDAPSPSDTGTSPSEAAPPPAPHASPERPATAPSGTSPPGAGPAPSALDLPPSPSDSSVPSAVGVDSAGAQPLQDSFTPQSRPEAPPATRVMLELLVVGASGDAGGLGGGGAVAWFPMPALGLRLGAGGRSSTLDAAQSSGLTLFTSAGAVLRPWRATHARPFEISVRVDYVVSHVSLTHFDNDEPSPITQARWLSGIAAGVDAGWLFATMVEAVVGVGFQDDFGTTEVEDKGAQVATIPSLRLIGEGGVRVRF
jgi:hypothetical protein